jgi:hypothetical protein
MFGVNGIAMIMLMPGWNDVRMHMIDVLESVDAVRECMRMQQLSIVETYLDLLPTTPDVRVRELLLAKAVYAFQLSADRGVSKVQRAQRDRVWKRLIDAQTRTTTVNSNAHSQLASVIEDHKTLNREVRRCERSGRSAAPPNSTHFQRQRAPLAHGHQYAFKSDARHALFARHLFQRMPFTHDSRPHLLRASGRFLLVRHGPVLNCSIGE